MYFPISAYEKIQIEAPYHALTNAGHITYVELDGDPVKNLDAFEKVIRTMKEAGIGYGSINHPVDRDPVCGYSGIIDDECPGCGRQENDGPIGFERIRRITGYLLALLTDSMMPSVRRWKTVSNIISHKIRVAGIVNDSITDGPGIRLTLFVQGCERNCPGVIIQVHYL